MSSDGNVFVSILISFYRSCHSYRAKNYHSICRWWARVSRVIYQNLHVSRLSFPKEDNTKGPFKSRTLRGSQGLKHGRLEHKKTAPTQEPMVAEKWSQLKIILSIWFGRGPNSLALPIEGPPSRKNRKERTEGPTNTQEPRNFTLLRSPTHVLKLPAYL